LILFPFFFFFFENKKIGTLVEIVNPDIRSGSSGRFPNSEPITSCSYELHISSSGTTSFSQFNGHETFREPLLLNGWVSLSNLAKEASTNSIVDVLVCFKEVSSLMSFSLKLEKKKKNKTKQNKTKQNKTKQNKTKQKNKTKSSIFSFPLYKK